MNKKSEDHDTMSMMFKRHGVPPHKIMDNSKERSLGGFRCKCHEADFHLINSEPYSPCHISAQGCIKALKKSFSRKLISTGSPKVI